MNNLLKAFMAAVLALGVAGSAMAQQERANKDEAVAMVKAAFDHIKKAGPEKAFDDFTNDKGNWIKKDLYVMVYDNSGKTLAHGGNAKLVGKMLSNVKDVNGVAIFAGMLETAAKGGGWFNYDWPDPVTQKVMPKTTYVIRQPNGEGFIGVGVYR